MESESNDYFCSVCETTFLLMNKMLDGIHIEHKSGEQLTITTAECPNCGSMSIPEGLNQIMWLTNE